MLKNFFLSEKKLLNAILRAKLKYMKKSSNEMNSFLQCRRQIFMCLSFFAEKVNLELKMHKIPSLELIRTQILCFKSKAQVHEKNSF